MNENLLIYLLSDDFNYIDLGCYSDEVYDIISNLMTKEKVIFRDSVCIAGTIKKVLINRYILIPPETICDLLKSGELPIHNSVVYDKKDTPDITKFLYMLAKQNLSKFSVNLRLITEFVV